MIKIIASDLDGTLLHHGEQTLNEELFPLIRKLKEKGVLFVAASGRQYPNLRRLFAPVADDIAYICENGALMVYKGQILHKSIMDKETGRKLIRDIISRRDCEVLVSGENTSYIQPKQDSYRRLLADTVKNNVMIVEDLEKIPEDYIKISVFNQFGITLELEEALKSTFQDILEPAVSGLAWMDFVSKGTNKGTALSILKEKLQVSKNETVVFGDNYNDIECLMEARYSYVMENARDEIKKYGNFTCKNVEKIMEDILLDFSETIS